MPLVEGEEVTAAVLIPAVVDPNTGARDGKRQGPAPGGVGGGLDGDVCAILSARISGGGLCYPSPWPWSTPTHKHATVRQAGRHAGRVGVRGARGVLAEGS
jgi:hypothetical protein